MYDMNGLCNIIMFQRKPKKSIDLYATMKKMQEMNLLVLGVYVNVAALTASANAKIHLKLRMPVSAFHDIIEFKSSFQIV